MGYDTASQINAPWTGEQPSEQGLALLDRLRMWMSQKAGGNWTPDAPAAALNQLQAVPAKPTAAAQAAAQADAGRKAMAQPAGPRPVTGNTAAAIAQKSPSHLDEFQQRMNEIGGGKAAVTQAQAQAMLDALAQRKEGKSAEEYQALLDKTKKQEVDPWKSRTSSDALLAFGSGLLANRGRNVGGALKSAVKDVWIPGRDREEAAAEKAYDRAIAQGATKIGLGQQDRTDANAALEQKAKALQMMAGAANAPLEAQAAAAEFRAKGGESALTRANELEKVRLKNAGEMQQVNARIGAIAEKSPAQQAEAWADAMTTAGDKRPKQELMQEFLRKGKAQAELSPLAKAAAEHAMKNAIDRGAVLTPFDQQRFALGYTPKDVDKATKRLIWDN